MADFTKDEVLALIERCDREARVTEAESRRPMEFNARHNIDLHIRNCNIVATALRALAKSMDAEPVAWLHPTAGWAHADKTVISPHCLNDGSDGGPIPLYAAPPATGSAGALAGGALEDVVEWHKKEIADLEGKIERNNAYKRKVGSHDDSANERCRSAIHHHRWSIDAVLRIRSALAEQPAPVAKAGAAVPAGALPPAPSYHDLHITTEDLPRTSIFNLPFNVSVSCRRTTGWTVWHRPDDRGDERLLAGEYDTHGLRLDVAGVIICDSLTTASDPASQNGEEL